MLLVLVHIVIFQISEKSSRIEIVYTNCVGTNFRSLERSGIPVGINSLKVNNL